MLPHPCSPATLDRRSPNELADPDEPQLMRQQDGIIEADACTHIGDLNDHYQLDLPEGTECDTLNGFLLSQIGRIPQQGKSHLWRNVWFTVLEPDERQLKRIRLEQIGSPLELIGSNCRLKSARRHVHRRKGDF